MKYPGNKSDKEQVFLTPSSILKHYDGWFDPCPHPRPVDFNGLEMSWGEKAFVNPPWGNIRPWVEKSYFGKREGLRCAYVDSGQANDPSVSRPDLPKC